MSHLTRSSRLFLVLGAASLAACGASKRVAPVTKGNISVTIIPASGVTPSVVVTGPQGYSKTLTSTQVLTGLPFGEYTIAADSAMGADSVVGMLIDTASVAGSPVTLSAHDTVPATVTYGFKGRTGGLWIANNAYGTIPEYAATQLRDTGTLVPAETLATAAGGPAGLALDAHGNMWESDFVNDSLFMYTAADRNSGATTPSKTIASIEISAGNDVAVDHQGNLWVADGNGLLFEYTPAQQTAGGTQHPNLTISGPALASAAALTFNAAGNLWVADNGNSQLLEYASAQLTTTGSTCAGTPVACTPTPAVIVSASSNSLNSPGGLAFDATGNLWVTNSSGSTVVEFTPAQLATTGAPTPQVTITTPNLSIPVGVAVDNRGSLWVSDGHNGAVYAFTAAQIATSGSPAPSIAIRGALASYTPAQILFDPYSTTTTLLAQRVHGRQPAASRRGRMNPSTVRALRAHGVMR